MLGKLGRRAIDLAVLFLSLYAFAFVPLGERTGLEHLKAVLSTPAAKSAGRELLAAAARLHERLLGTEPETRTSFGGEPIVPELPRRRAPENAHTVAAEGARPPSAHGPDASQ